MGKGFGLGVITGLLSHVAFLLSVTAVMLHREACEASTLGFIFRFIMFL